MKPYITEVIEALKGLAALQELDISENDLTDADVIAIVNTPSLKDHGRFTSLNMGLNGNIGDEGAEAVAGLTDLDMASANITDRGA